MLPLHPDDCSPSKSRQKVNYFVNNGTEYTLEVRSEYDGVSSQRMGELHLWKEHDNGQLTAKLTEQADE